MSLWEPIPLGVDEQGEPVAIELVERNVLIGGEPGAGKSAALSTLIAAAALDPDARIWLLDGKLVELAAWAPVAQRVVGPATARRRSSCCARSARRWRSATASCSPAGSARSGARTGCRCTWSCATSWRST